MCISYIGDTENYKVMEYKKKLFYKIITMKQENNFCAKI